MMPQSSISVAEPYKMQDFPIAILGIGFDGVVQSANGLALCLLSVKQVEGRHLASLVDGPGRQVSDWIQDAIEGRGLNRCETMRVKMAKGDQFVQVSLSKTEHMLLAVLTDATELSSLKAQVAQSQKMQAVGQLAGGVAHDFNNLLTAITGSCDLLSEKFSDDAVALQDLTRIRANVDRASHLVRQLLAFSRKQPLKTVLFSVEDMISGCSELLSSLLGPKHRLDINVDPGLPKIRSDRMQLEQVLMNLVVNAQQAMMQGGVISLRARRVLLVDPMQRENVTMPAGSYVLMSVSDTGTGIAPEILPKIFEPFFTTKKAGEGTGLGLSMVYGIIKQTGGFIFADGNDGLGATLSVYLPATEHEVIESPQSTPLRSVTNSAPDSAIILLVEDEEAVRNLAARALRLEGHKVIEADCAEHALDLLKDSGLSVDLFISDVIMPGLNGPEWVQQALKDRPHTPVIFVSGYTDDAFMDGSTLATNSTFLSKPYSLRQLAKAARMQLK